MKKIENQPVTGGGARIADPQDIILLRIKLYVERKWKSDIKSLSKMNRPKAVFVLVRHFGFTYRQLAPVFNVSKDTIQRDFQWAELFSYRATNYRNELERIYKYVLN